MTDSLLQHIDRLLNENISTTEPNPLLRRLDDITREEISWLWPDWLATGKLTVLGGHPGDGKTTLAHAIAARLSAGEPMPDGAPSIKTNILILASEDGVADTIRPRLEDHGADLAGCFALDEIAVPTEDQPDRTRPVNLIRDLNLIEAVIRDNAIRLLIVDPITTFLSGADCNAEGDVRDALHPLLKLLDRTNCACLAIMHVGKPN